MRGWTAQSAKEGYKMDSKNKGIGIGVARVLVVIAGGLGMGCIGEDTTEMDKLTEQISALEDKIAQAEDKATEQAFMDMIAELKAEIAELKAVDELPTSYIIVKHTTTELNESFSAWGECGRTAWHVKAKALERAEDFADDLSLQEDVTDILVKYDGREREWLNNGTDCYISYFYLVTWVENEYTEEIVLIY
jgi:hypothetical protein